MNCPPHPLIGSAPAHRIRHSGIDIGIRRLGFFAQKRSGGHDHSSLTITTLRDVLIEPGSLAGMCAVDREPFNGSETFSVRRGDRNLAGSNRDSRLVNCASAANTHPAAVLCAGHLKQIPQHPQERHVRRSFNRARAIVNGKRKLGHQVSKNRRVQRRIVSVSRCHKVHRWSAIQKLLDNLKPFLQSLLCRYGRQADAHGDRDIVAIDRKG